MMAPDKESQKEIEKIVPCNKEANNTRVSPTITISLGPYNSKATRTIIFANPILKPGTTIKKAIDFPLIEE